MRLGGGSREEEIAALINSIWKLMESLNVPTSIKACGVDEKEFFSKVPALAEHAFEDQCTTANPRYPLIKDLEEIYRKAYYGERS